MSTNSFLSREVDLTSLAERTKNFSGAELEGLVKDAAAFALNRNVDFNDLHKPLDEDSIKVGAWSSGWLPVLALVALVAVSCCKLPRQGCASG
jgi:hypothetical protein